MKKRGKKSAAVLGRAQDPPKGALDKTAAAQRGEKREGRRARENIFFFFFKPPGGGKEPDSLRGHRI